SHSHLALFVFSPSPHHPNLPSFPTRRSSDLEARVTTAAAAIAAIATRWLLPATTERHDRGFGFKASSVVGGHGLEQPQYARALRSEEHTSELQSLAYLVCRLLLEKKKKIIRQ